MSADCDPHNRFNDLVGDLDYPMLIVTARSETGERAGCLVGFATQCSLDPCRFIVCISKANRTYRVARTAELVGVHFVPSSATALADLFGGQTGDDIDKFARCEWCEGRSGVPILADCRNWFVGAILDRLDLGDHVGLLLDPVDVGLQVLQPTLTFHRARRIDPGHEA